MVAGALVTRALRRGQQPERELRTMHVVAAIELGEFARDLALASGTGIEDAARQVTRDASVQTLQLAQVYAPSRTGELRSSIGITYGPGGTSAEVRATAPHAAYVEFGTGLYNELVPVGMRRPYVIEPKRPGGSLRFMVGDGSIVFTRRVIHPGIKAQPFMRPAAERVAEAFAHGLANAGTKVIVEGRF